MSYSEVPGGMPETQNTFGLLVMIWLLVRVLFLFGFSKICRYK